VIQDPNPNPTTTLTAGQVVVTVPGVGGAASAIYRGFRAQRTELANQLEELQDTRSQLMREIEQLPQGAAGRAGLEARVAAIDTRIAAMDKQIADADAQVAKAAAVPGAIVEPPRIVRSGPPEEMYIAGMVFTFICAIPLVIAWSRRLWKRASVTVTQFPKEISDRLARLEQSADSTAIEVERIGEGQRFLTKILSEGNMVPAIGAASSTMIADRKGEGSSRP
jgi:hypothetical protein